jgi:hypothetical protein
MDWDDIGCYSLLIAIVFSFIVSSGCIAYAYFVPNTWTILLAVLGAIAIITMIVFIISLFKRD